MFPYLAVALSTAGMFASVSCAAQLWQLSLKCIQRETPSQLADACANDFPSDGAKCFKSAWWCLRRSCCSKSKSAKDHLRNGHRHCTEKGAAHFKSTKEQHCRVCLVQVPAPFCSFPSASLYPLSQTGLTNALAIRPGCCSSSQLSCLVAQRKTEVCSVCVSLATNSGSFCSKRRGD